MSSPHIFAPAAKTPARPRTYSYDRAIAQVRAEQLQKLVGQGLPAPRTVTREEWPPNYDAVYAWRRQQLAYFELNPQHIVNAKAWYRTRPAAFINHWCDLYEPRNAARKQPVHFPFVMFPRQEEFVDFLNAITKSEAPGLVEKSRDMGATWLASAYSVHDWLLSETAVDIGWGSRKQEQVDRIGDPKSIFEKMRMQIRWIPRVFWPIGFSPEANMLHTRIINPETGSVITGESGDNIGRGGRANYYIVDEAAHLDHPEKVEAALSETTRVRIDISSVSAPGTVFHRTREAGVEWAPGKPIAQTRANVFVMDWSDHPEKDEAWHKGRQSYFASKGLRHVFAQEIDRDYAGAAKGACILQEWVRSAIDAHLHPKLKAKFSTTGKWLAALDVADNDGSLDNNAFARRQGNILRYIEEWSERDTGVTARRAVMGCRDVGWCELQYDCIGVGSGVKAETNRMRDEKLIAKNMVILPWDAGDTVLNPFERVIPNDRESLMNRDFYQNLKAQAWWMLARRFEVTHRALTEDDFTYDVNDLISIDRAGVGEMLPKLMKELSQATVGYSAALKVMINKKPEGAKSPNLGDATVMCFWPVHPPVPATSIIAPRVL